MPKKQVTPKQKQKTSKTVKKGRMYITATFNNTVVTVTDPEGNVVCSGSAGSSGFKGARRATPYAASKTVALLLEKMKAFDMYELEVYLRGAGMGREAALRALKTSPVSLSLIADITPMPHNGIRAKKRRRV